MWKPICNVQLTICILLALSWCHVTLATDEVQNPHDSNEEDLGQPAENQQTPKTSVIDASSKSVTNDDVTQDKISIANKESPVESNPSISQSESKAPPVPQSEFEAAHIDSPKYIPSHDLESSLPPYAFFSKTGGDYDNNNAYNFPDNSGVGYNDKRFMKGFIRRGFLDPVYSHDEIDKRFMKGFHKKSSDTTFIDTPMSDEKRFMRGFVKRNGLKNLDEIGEKRFMRGFRSPNAGMRYFDPTQMYETAGIDTKRFMHGFQKRNLVNNWSPDSSVISDKRFMRGFGVKRDGGNDIVDVEDDLAKRFMKGLVKKESNSVIPGNPAITIGSMEQNDYDKRFMHGFVKKDDYDKRFMHGFVKKDYVDNKRFMHGFAKKDDEKRFMHGFAKKDDIDDVKRFMHGFTKKDDIGDVKRFMHGFTKKDDIDGVKRFMHGFTKKDDIDGVKRFMHGFTKKDDIDGVKRFMHGFTKKDDVDENRLMYELPTDDEIYNKRFMHGFSKKDNDDKRFIHGMVKRESSATGTDHDDISSVPLTRRKRQSPDAPDFSQTDTSATPASRLLGRIREAFIPQAWHDAPAAREGLVDDKRFIKGLYDKRFDDVSDEGGMSLEDLDKRFILGFPSNRYTLDNGDGEPSYDVNKRFMIGFENLDKKFMRGFDRYSRNQPDKRFMNGFENLRKRDGDDQEEDNDDDNGYFYSNEKRFMHGLENLRKRDNLDKDKRFMKGFGLSSVPSNQYMGMPDKRFMRGFERYDRNDDIKRFMMGYNRYFVPKSKNRPSASSYLPSVRLNSEFSRFQPKRGFTRRLYAPDQLSSPKGSRQFMSWRNGAYVLG